MSRFVDLILVMVGTLAIIVVQTSTAPMMEELRSHGVEEDRAGDNIDATEISNEMHTAVVKWVPTVAGFGLWIVAGFREYRRQRVTAVRRRRI